MTSTLNVSKIEPLSGSGTIHVGSDSSNTVSINTTTQAVTLAGAATINGATNITGATTITGNVVPGTSNTYSLGSNTATFQSAFLGSGIYLGGTLATNLLDNYVNDGTWSPIFCDINGNAIFNESPAIQEGKYQRVGDYVYLSGYIANPGGGVSGTSYYGSTNGTYIGGLPFAVPAGNGGYYAGAVSYQASLASGFDSTTLGFPISLITEAGYSVLRLHYPAAATQLGLQNQYLGASTAFIFSVNYKIT